MRVPESIAARIKKEGSTLAKVRKAIAKYPTEYPAKGCRCSFCSLARFDKRNKKEAV